MQLTDEGNGKKNSCKNLRKDHHVELVNTHVHYNKNYLNTNHEKILASSPCDKYRYIVQCVDERIEK